MVDMKAVKMEMMKAELKVAMMEETTAELKVDLMAALTAVHLVAESADVMADVMAD